jgi:hypothetical protein
MKIAVIAIAALCACMVCGCAPMMRTGAHAESTIRKVFQAGLPASATNAFVSSGSLMTLVVHGRFECDKSDLSSFLAESRLLPDELNAGVNPLRAIQQPSLPWWQPASLRAASGVKCDWDAGSDVASCTLVTGMEPENERLVVTFMVVYESKTQSGLRPETKVDPNWGTETNEISNSSLHGSTESRASAPSPAP